MGKERTIITQELCDHVKILLAGGASVLKAAEITKAGKATIYRIKAAGYDAEVYRKNTEIQRGNEKKPAEEQISGQISMELTQTEKPTQEMVDRTKFMRFEAGQADLTRKAIAESAIMLNTKLDRLNDTLCMILRAMRKE